MKQMALSLPGTENMRSDSFVVGACNRLALALINSWPSGWHKGVCITGEAGCGKTHLLRLWRHIADAGDLADVMAGNNDIVAKHWLLDDLEQWLGYRDVEERLFHLLNRVAADGGTVLVASRLPPSRLEFAIPDVRSRLMAFTVAEIAPPDDEMLAAVIRKLLVDRQIHSDSGLVSYLLKRTGRSFAEVQKAVAELDEISLERKRALNTRLAQEWLKAS